MTIRDIQGLALALSGLLSLASCSHALTRDDAERPASTGTATIANEPSVTGFVQASSSEYAAYPRFAPANGASPSARMPVVLNLSPLCGRVRNQYSRNSCTAEAIASLKNYQEGLDQKWSTDDLMNQFSAAFVYNIVNGARDKGISFPQAFWVLSALGCPTNKSMPDDKTVYTTLPSEAAMEEAAEFKIASVETCDISNADSIVTALSEGLPVLAAIRVYPTLASLSPANSVYDKGLLDSEVGRHAVLITGYNQDTRLLRFRNSYGEAWGCDGDGFIAYDKVPRLLLEAYVVRDAIHPIAPIVASPEVYSEGFDSGALSSWIVDTRNTASDSWSMSAGALTQSSSSTSDSAKGVDGYTSRKAAKWTSIGVAAGTKKLVAECDASVGDRTGFPTLAFALNFRGTHEGSIWVQNRYRYSKDEADRKILGAIFDGKAISTWAAPSGYSWGSPLGAEELGLSAPGARLRLILELDFEASTCSAWIGYPDGSKRTVAVGLPLAGLRDFVGSDMAIQPSVGCLDTVASFDSITITKY